MAKDGLRTERLAASEDTSVMAKDGLRTERLAASHSAVAKSEWG